jgi:hypothetical protein
MNAMIKHAAIVSTAALMTIGTAGLAGAQTKSYGEAQMQPKGDQSDFCAANPNKCGMNKPGGDVNVEQPKMKQAQGDWKFDSNRQERRRHKDATFRFYLGGYWYPQPYWLGYGLRVNSRISCGEGRSILRDRGFYRVRPIECQGRTYTYFGFRHGDTFKVLLNARTGRIVGVNGA